MKKTLFEEVAPDQRLQLIKDNADGTEIKYYNRPYTPEELDSIKDEFSTQHIEAGAIRAELNAIKADYKIKLKPYENRIGQLLQALKDKTESVEATTYMFEDQENGMMLYYDAEGNLIDSRRLRPDEKQTKMRIEKNGTN